MATLKLLSYSYNRERDFDMVPNNGLYHYLFNRQMHVYIHHINDEEQNHLYFDPHPYTNLI
jgi:hypothetical protein